MTTALDDDQVGATGSELLVTASVLVEPSQKRVFVILVVATSCSIACASQCRGRAGNWIVVVAAFDITRSSWDSKRS